MFESAKERLLAAYTEIAKRNDAADFDARLNDFQANYGPAVLKNLRGQELMDFWHGRQAREGLLHFLEYGAGSDGFGSILGGSALKFKVYRGSDGDWKTKGRGNVPVSCSEAEAIRITETLADNILQACRWVDELNLKQADESVWQEFQRYAATMTPALQEEGFNSGTLILNWAHKYLAMTYVDVFSYHHRTRHLSEHLVRLGFLPPNTRYGNDGKWRSVRLGDRELASCHPVLLMLAAYDERSGFGYNTGYWRIGTDEGDEFSKVDTWPSMRDRDYICIGWNPLGDLSVELEGLSGEAAIGRLKELLRAQYPERSATTIGKWAKQIREFFEVMKPGDRVAAMKGRQLLGVGEVTSDYSYQSEGIQHHRRECQWHWVTPAAREGSGKVGETWNDSPGFMTTLYDFREKWPDALHVEQRFLTGDYTPLLTPKQNEAPVPPAPPVQQVPLDARTTQIKQVLERKGQVILYGPPGTGKTYNARHAAHEILARELFAGASWANLAAPQREAVEQRIAFCTFHPAYTYEEFIEGFRPEVTPQGATFKLRDGLFLEACQRATESSAPYVLIIDEINRANVAAVMGELLTLLEKDKRGSLKLTLPLSRREFTVPTNLWVIGTMNTADRSIALLDAALRRRFGFVELLPEPERLDVTIEGLHIGTLLQELNVRVRQHVPRNARELQVGHAYFLHEGQPLSTSAALHAAMRDDVLPLLAEYCYEDYAALTAIVGEAMVDVDAQRVRIEVQQNERAMIAALKQIIAEVEPLRPNDESGEADENGSDVEGDNSPVDIEGSVRDQQQRKR